MIFSTGVKAITSLELNSAYGVAEVERVTPPFRNVPSTIIVEFFKSDEFSLNVIFFSPDPYIHLI